jgi:nucleoside-diphosphate-sugar epimerase
MRRLLQLAKLPIPLPFGAVNNRRSLLAVENLIAAIVLLIDRDDLSREVFLISDDTPVSLPDMISCLRTGMGKSPNLLSLSPEPVAAFFRITGMPHLWERLAGNLVVSPTRLKAIGYAPVIATPTGLRELGRRMNSQRRDYIALF